MTVLKALFSGLVFLVFVGGLALVGGYLWFQNEMSRPGPAVTGDVFVVSSGEGLGGIASRLEEAGIIRDGRLMRLAFRLDGTGATAKAGEYAIPAGASLAEVKARLIAGDAVLHRITIPEGLTTAQILRLVEADPILEGALPEAAPDEGTLLPDTYFFSRGMTRADLLDLMEEAQDDLIDELWPHRQAGLPLASPEEAIILASVVEKETGLPEERGQIAGLFVGRLKRSMRLESDPTIIYGVSGGEPLYNSRGERRTLYRSEIDRATDWNTYQIDGLPRTPICNPGRDAIAATLQPDDTDYVFFVADGTGGHAFAKTLAEHNRNVAAYRRIERERIAQERAN
ncbi:MAG: endolytic transglycosylase MltG [Pseudomonadota bacterium]